MKRNNPAFRLARRTLLLSLPLAFTWVSGCKNMIRRAQSPDSLVENEDDQKRNYIGKACRVWGLNYAKVEGIGLAVNLKSTGSNPTSSGQKEHLKRELEACKIENINDEIASEDTSMVLLRGYLPPGIRKGEPYDVEVGLMPNSETTSIERGFVLKTSLRPIAKMGRSLKQGSLYGYAEGQIMVDSLFSNDEGTEERKRGWIYGGGVALEGRPIGLTIFAEKSNVQLATAISTAINKRYTVIDRSGRRGAAVPKTDRRIELSIPEEYRLNITRFLQGIMNTVYNETTKDRADRLDQLDRQLSNPNTAQTAAVRLEAIGQNGIPALKRALRHTDAKVRFFAAQALAYLGEHDGVKDLESTAASDPVFRWQALTALSSIQHTSSRESLENLLHADGAETRYGAFCSLKARDKNDLLVQGQRLANSFQFNAIQSDTTQPLIHISRAKRPEIVLFGKDQTVKENFAYVEAGLTVKSVSPTNVKISCYLPERSGSITCGNSIEQVIRGLAKMGYGYGTVVKVFRRAAKADMLNSRLAINAVPNARKSKNRKQQLVMTQESESEVEPVPELFRNPEEPTKKPKRAQVANLKGKSTNPVTRLKDMFSGKNTEE